MNWTAAFIFMALATMVASLAVDTWPQRVVFFVLGYLFMVATIGTL